MAIVNGYVDRTEMKRWLEIDAPSEPHKLDELIDAAVNGVSRWLDTKCKRHFFQVEEARDFWASDYYNLDLGHFNDLVSVDALSTDDDGDGVFEGAWSENVDFELRPRNVMAGAEENPYRSVRAIGRRFPINLAAGGRIERIRILGVWGWPAVPDGIVQTTKLQVARIVKRREAPEGIAGLGQFGVVRMTRVDPDVQAGYQPYRLRSVG